MNFHKPQNLKDIADLIQCSFIGAPDFPVFGTNEIHRVRPGDIVFVNHPKYYDKALNSAATVILIDKEVECPPNKALLISEDPFGDFNRINTHFTRITNFKDELHNVEIGENTFIHPSAVIGNDVKIGSNCTVFPNVVIGERTVIGNDVTIQSGTVIGGDAFYYRKKDGVFDPLISVGNVIIEDKVNIGNLCTIDRGVTDATVLGYGTVIDNLIQIGHDTIIGKRCLIASHTGIAGCCKVGDDVTIWGQVGMASGTEVESGTVIMGKTGVNRNLSKGTYIGMFAEDYKDFLRKEISIKNMVGKQSKPDKN